MAQNEDRFGEYHTEKGHMHETLVGLQDDLTQYQAHIDLYKIRLKEEHDEKDFMKVCLYITIRFFLFVIRLSFIVESDQGNESIKESK